MNTCNMTDEEWNEQMDFRAEMAREYAEQVARDRQEEQAEQARRAERAEAADRYFQYSERN